MIDKTVVITNPLGIHARPAALIVQEAAQFAAEITLSKGDVTHINGKSIMGVMMLAAENGAEVTITADGDDEIEALEKIAALMQSNFEDTV
ncbi:MAG: HPr family phosphocarrier protein [Candidatus Latescibacterota bacterium]|nr:HPr family phosphocarrier protein [Candidatus Latescibacterota bacterium]